MIAVPYVVFQDNGDVYKRQVITNTGSDEFLGTTDPEKPKKPGKPGGGGGGGKLPQTGMLWWPVPALAASGILVFLLGWARNSKGKEENGE